MYWASVWDGGLIGGLGGPVWDGGGGGVCGALCGMGALLGAYRAPYGALQGMGLLELCGMGPYREHAGLCVGVQGRWGALEASIGYLWGKRPWGVALHSPPAFLPGHKGSQGT